MKIISRTILVICYSLLFFTNGYSQEKSKWSGQITLGGSYYKGNVNKIDIRSLCNISHKDSVYELSGGYKAIYGTADKKESNRELSAYLKFDWKPYSVISPFAVFQYYTNIHKGYDYKMSGILGAKYTFYSKPKKCNYSISAAGMYSYEKYTPPGDPLEEVKPDHEKFRLSIRPKFKQNLGENITFKHYTFYQPNIEDFNDYIIVSQTSLTSKLTKVLFLDFSFLYEFVSITPSTEIRKEDLSFVISLVVKIN